MPDFPINGPQSPFRLIIPHFQYREPNASSAAGAVNVANDVNLIPFEIDSMQQINQMLFLVAVQSGNIDVGIYTLAGVRIVSAGSTAMGAAGLQTVNIADTILGRGRYYAAYQINNATGTIVEVTPLGGASAGAVGLMGVKKASPVFPLPATITPATPTRTTVPLMALEMA